MNDALTSAVASLARREHGAKELALKLTQKGYEAADIDGAIVECQRLGLQSDQRFVESFVRVRVQQGYGPESMRYELQQKQVDHDLFALVLTLEPVDWVAQAKQVLQKK